MVVLKINYTKHLDRAAKSVRYHAFRAREVPEADRGAFDRTSDRANVGEFIRSLDDPLTQDRKGRSGKGFQPAKMHRLMFSMRRRDFEAAGFTSWKPVIREALESFEKKHGIKLDWIAAEHLVESNPHVHVDVKSAYTAADGTRHRLKITNQLRIDLKAAVVEVIDRERTRADEERRHQQELTKTLKDMTQTLLRGLRDAARSDGTEHDELARNAKKRRPQPEHESDDRGR